MATFPLANKNTIGIGLTQASAISGQVLDGQGNPLQGANVYAIARRGADGAPRYIQFGNLGHTDDNGKYRLHGLPPGHYSVAVVPFGRVSNFAPVFFPGSNSPGEAEFLELKPGETTSANLRVAAAEARSISGKLSGMPADASAGRAAVALITRDGLQVAMSGAAADADGSFVLRDVPPGEYRLIAWTPHEGWDRGGRTPGADARSAARSISVSGVDLETGLDLQPLAKVTGRLILDRSHADGLPVPRRQGDCLSFRRWLGQRVAAGGCGGRRGHPRRGLAGRPLQDLDAWSWRFVPPHQRAGGRSGRAGWRCAD